jgi:hypothetical protein
VRAAVVVVWTLIALLLAAPASACRDDLPTETRSPAPGTRIKDATKGVEVRFTCPAYHPDTTDAIVNRDGEGYHVMLATASDIGPDGLLLAPNRVDIRDVIAIDDQPGLCTAAPDASDRGLLPREPGRYWWQSYRDCMTYICPFGTEISDLSDVTVVRTVCTTDRAALAAARKALAAARKAYKKHHTTARHDRVATLQARVSRLQSRLRVVDHCTASQ